MRKERKALLPNRPLLVDQTDLDQPFIAAMGDLFLT